MHLNGVQTVNHHCNRVVKDQGTSCGNSKDRSTNQMSFGIRQILVLIVEIIFGQIPTKFSQLYEQITFMNGLEEDFIRTTYSETALEVQNSYILLGKYRVPFR